VRGDSIPRETCVTLHVPVRRPSFTLIELLVAVTIVAVLMALGAASYRRSAEQARADVAAANLRSIWSAQRIYWLDQRHYAANFSDLRGLVDPAVTSGTATYSYAIVSADDTTFSVTATRIGSGVWAGTLTIDQTGVLSGTINGSSTITPGFQ
jgi:prepilin-type N-terminal cleavage/methylation domain-containing protein